MKYTKDNILNLRVRRGGTAEYDIIAAWTSYIELRHVNSGRIDALEINTALRYLTNGKWTVVGTGKEAVLEEEIYQIY